jgi:transcriptional regulator of acetoin/glycerol metabolism
MNFIDLVLDQKVDENKKNVEQLKELLTPFGIKVHLKNNVLTIGSTEEDIVRRTTRYAGRKKLELERTWDLKEVEKWIAATSAEEVAKKLGISRTTLFRKLKAAREANENVIN